MFILTEMPCYNLSIGREQAAKEELIYFKICMAIQLPNFAKVSFIDLSLETSLNAEIYVMKIKLV